MDHTSATYNKGTPPLRESDLTSSSTRYDVNLAAPPDAELRGYWSALAAVALVAGIFTLFIFVAVVSSRKARRQSFNMYLIYLMIPDFTFSLLCGITCLLNAVNGSYWSHWMCNFQQWYCVWGIGSNCWLNAVITFQLHSLLKCSHQRKRFWAPSRKTVTIQALAVYVYCTFLGTWGLISEKNFPFHAIQIRGLACIPVEADHRSTLFFWLVFMPVFSIIPIGYVLYVCWDVRRRKLLPPSGKRRLLTMYFGRIILVFLLMWGPYFLLNYILATWLPTWVIFAGGLFSHFQGPASACASLLKPDILIAVKCLAKCQCCAQLDEPVEPSCDTTADTTTADDSRRSVLFLLSTSFRKSFRFFLPPPRVQEASSPGVSERGVAPGTRGCQYINRSSVWPDKNGEYLEDDSERSVENQEGEDKEEPVSDEEESADRYSTREEEKECESTSTCRQEDQHCRRLSR